ncbi:MAG: NPCBM/NEW2 domain-containing protein [Defluviitaleaceae bacterium]|nr:NPCBM/NEW2 domain-containing protein [Defluviitaleaceae bacterium]
MKKSRRLPALLLALIMVLGLIPATTTQTYAASANLPPITVTVNGQLVNFTDQQPIMVENRVLVPVRGVFEMMGFEVTWDPDARIARLVRSDTTVVIPAASTSFVVNGVIVTPEVPQRMVAGRMLLPLRAVAEAVGGVPNWDPVQRRAMITTPLAPSPTPTASPSPTPTPSATPVPLLTAAPRFEGSPGFALGGNADIGGTRFPNSIFGGGHSQHNLNRNFATLTGTIGRLDGSGAGPRTIRFIGDGSELLAEYTVSGYAFTPINIAVDVRNVTILRLEVEAVGTDGVSVVFGTPMLHPTQATAPIPTPRPSPTPVASPAPLLTAAPRVDGSAGFGFGGSTHIVGNVHVTGAFWGGGWSTHNLNGRFATLTGTIGRQEGTTGTEARTIRFTTGYGRVLATHTISGTGTAQNITVNVHGVATLRIDIDAPGTNGATIVFGNTMLQPSGTSPTPTPAATAAPLLNAAPRTDGSAGFGFGVSTSIVGGSHQSGALVGGGWSTHNLNGRFTTLTGTIGRQDGTPGTEARTIRFMTGYGRVLSTHTVSGTGSATHISVPVHGVATLRIEIDAPGAHGSTIVFGNTMLHPTHTTPTPTPAATAAPLLNAAPRTDGSAGFATGTGATTHIVGGVHQSGAIVGGGWSTHNLNGRFTTLTGTIGRQYGTAGTEARTIRFSTGYGRVIATHTVSGAGTATNISVPVHGVTTLRIEIDAPGANGSTIVFGNTTLHPTHATPTPTPVATAAPLLHAAPRTDGSAGLATGLGVTTNIVGGSHQTGAITSGGWSTHNLNGRFTTLTGTIGRQDGTAGTEARTIRFSTGYGRVLATHTVAGAGTATSISVPVHGVATLRVEIDAPGTNGATIVFGNTMLHPTYTAHTTPTPAPTVAPQQFFSAATRLDGTAGFGFASTAHVGGVAHHNAIVAHPNYGFSWATYNIGAQFATLTAVIGRNDAFSGTLPRTIRFVGNDGAILRTEVINPNDALRQITVPISGVTTLRIEMEGHGTNGVSIMVGNIMLVPPTPLVNVTRTGGSGTFGTQGHTITLGNVNHPNSIWGGGYTVHHLNRQYTTFEATIGRRADIAGNDSRYVRIYRDGVLFQAYRVYGPQFTPISISVPVGDTTNLTIRIDEPGANGATAAVGNPRLR